MQLIVLTGLSGSGKSIALKQLEDLGFYCVDNLPAAFLVSVAEHLKQSGRQLAAVSVDSRSDVSLPQLPEQFESLRQKGFDLRILCLTASTNALVKRYSETRRQHPLTLRGEASGTLTEAIEAERKMLEGILTHSHLIDTTDLLPATLSQWIRRFVRAKEDSLILTFESFGFKRGIPLASDLVFDVRCLPNPYWDPALRGFTGLDQPVIDFLQSKPQVQSMVDDITAFLEKWLPAYQAQNRHYLTVSIGCTGGQHRSVYIAQALSTRFSTWRGSVVTRHRTLDALNKPA